MDLFVDPIAFNDAITIVCWCTRFVHYVIFMRFFIVTGGREGFIETTLKMPLKRADIRSPLTKFTVTDLKS